MVEIKNIAVVDDHIMFRKGLAVLINKFPGYHVMFEAANGKEFIDRLNPILLPDIVLLDVNMPEMDGYETAEWLRIHQPGIKVLALSMMDTETAIFKMVKQGAKGYLLKDAEPEELKLAFDEVLNHGYFYNDLVTPEIVQSLS